MAIVKRDLPTASTPSYTPDIATDYNNQNAYLVGNAQGYNSISLTNWDSSTTKPQVAAGSAIEINGVVYDFTTATDIDTSGASSGTIYLYFDDGTPEFKFLDTAPTWSATLNGWYNSGDRFTGHMAFWNGVSMYLGKKYARNKQDGLTQALPAGGGPLSGSIRLDWLSVTSDSFASPSTTPLGLTYAGNNLISCDQTATLIYVHNGISSSIGSSFAAPHATISGLTFDGTNLISCAYTPNLIYIHDGITASIGSSFASPASNVWGLAYDGTNLISCDEVTARIYIHDGISTTTTSDFAAPGSDPTGLTFDGTNLISCDNVTNKIYIHDGITSTILASFTGGSTDPNGLAYSGIKLISCDNNTNYIYVHGV